MTNRPSILSMAKLTPDPWQASLLTAPPNRTLLLCSRSAGKSEAAAALAVLTALLSPKQLVLMLSPTERQSGELMLKARRFYDAARRPVQTTKETELEIRLSNGSRLIALPGIERTIRTYNGVALLVIDEASRVPDDLYRTVRPMLAVSRGRLLALSTPFGKRGWFYEAWSGSEPWDRVEVKATQCPRITAEFLAEERRTLGDRWYNQEYLCSFEETVGAVFSGTDIAAAMSDDVQPMFGARTNGFVHAGP